MTAPVTIDFAGDAMPADDHARADARSLGQLGQRFPLPRDWTVELWSDVVKIGALVLRAVGIAARNSDGQMLSGSAVALRRSPIARAYFELLERLSALEASTNATNALPELTMFDRRHRTIGNASAEGVFPRSHRPEWKYSISNGIALHRSWSQAAAHAYFELAERDRVLRSWYGQTAPRRIEIARWSINKALRGFYELEAYEFASGPGAKAVGVFAFPEQKTAPLAYGFGARLSTSAALERALAECLQRLAFLWGEDVPVEPPAPEPTPDFHQEFYLCRRSHAKLRAWLNGGHRRCAVPLGGRRRGRRARFVDLTPEWLKGARVAKALPDDELPLVFGWGSPIVETALPETMAVHPIA